MISEALAANSVADTGSSGGGYALLIILGSVAVLWLVYSLQKRLRKRAAGREKGTQ